MSDEGWDWSFVKYAFPYQHLVVEITTEMIKACRLEVLMYIEKDLVHIRLE